MRFGVFTSTLTHFSARFTAAILCKYAAVVGGSRMIDVRAVIGHTGATIRPSARGSPCIIVDVRSERAGSVTAVLVRILCQP